VLVLACGLAFSPPVSRAEEEQTRIADASSPSRDVDDATIERLRRLHHTESHEVRMVLLPTSVTDKKGRTVQNLEKKHFRLYDDRQLQEIRYFSSEAREPI
jgi:hypothetical protein